MKKTILFLNLTLFTLSGLTANVSLPRIFSNNMILQRGIDIPVWGWAEKGEKITVIFDKETQNVVADKDGNWKINLQSHNAGGPFELKVQGKNELVYNNVLVGDVWICSGQSNMEFQLTRANNAEKEIAEANYPKIRLFTVERSISVSPEKDLKNNEKWVECNPNTITDFSAVAYFFGRELTKKYNIPIGLIDASWGGTEVEAWTSLESIKTVSDFNEEVNKLSNTDLDELKKKETQFIIDWEEQILEKDKGYIDGKAAWANADLDDSNWGRMNLPVLWEDAGLKNLDGVVWFRKEFELSEKAASQDITINLGTIDDSDHSFINGALIGETINQYSKSRTYIVDKKLLKAGKNILVVRVEDYRGGGGFSGKEQYMNIETADNKISLAGEWKFSIGTDKIPTFPKNMLTNMNPNNLVSSLYNSMINPLVPYGIKGAIWYQGESNASRAYQYRTLFPLMINDWRSHWNEGNFSFLFVQIANFLAPDSVPKDDPWPELREAQDMTLSLSNTGMACIIDIGLANNIHPTNKQDVGKRLAAAAYKIAYDEDVVYSGPRYKSFVSNGNKVSITFNNVGSGLMIKDKFNCLGGFALAGSDKKYYYASGKILNNNTVVISSDKVTQPLTIRYAWANNPDRASLYNKEGFPAVPFRTDDWNGVTFGVK